ncbi:unnamed protein product, partial [Sphacelaria rigidula]
NNDSEPGSADQQAKGDKKKEGGTERETNREGDQSSKKEGETTKDDERARSRDDGNGTKYDGRKVVDSPAAAENTKEAEGSQNQMSAPLATEAAVGAVPETAEQVRVSKAGSTREEPQEKSHKNG